MPVRLIPCRLREDHSVTQELGETALPYFPEWEPIPADELPEDVVPPEPVQAPEPAPEETEEERDERNRRVLAEERTSEDTEDKPSRPRSRKTPTKEEE